MFQRNLSLHLQGERISQARNNLEAGFKENVPPKHLLTFTVLHHFICQKIELITTTVRILNFTCMCCLIFQMTRYFLKQESPKDKQKPQNKDKEGSIKELETFKRSKYKSSIEKSQKEVNALVTVVKYKRKEWKGRKYEDDRLAGARVQAPWNRKSKHVPVPEEKLARHSRGEGLSGDGIKTSFHQKKLKKHESNIEFSIEQAARAEILLPEESG